MKRKLILFASTLLICSTYAQELIIDNDGMFFLGSSVDFTVSGSTVKQNGTGKFVMEAGNSWAISTNEYVDGKIILTGHGTAYVNVGDDDAKSSLSLTIASGDEVEVNYIQDTPPSGGMSSIPSYSLSDTEYWTVTKLAGDSEDFVVSDIIEAEGATYNGETSVNAPILVRLESGNWVPYDGNPGAGTFSLAAEIETLSNVETIIKSSDLIVYETSSESIKVKTPSNIRTLDISIFDSLGKLVANYPNTHPNGFTNEVSLNNHNLSDGVYIMHFYLNNNSVRLAKKIIVH